MTVVFIVGVALSVLLQILQIFSLSKYHDRSLWHLRAAAWAKSIILIFAVVVVIIFVASYATCHGEAQPRDHRCQVVVSIAGVVSRVSIKMLERRADMPSSVNGSWPFS